MTRAAHRASRVPWHARALCWLYGHHARRLPGGSYVHCSRCDRITPEETT